MQRFTQTKQSRLQKHFLYDISGQINLNYMLDLVLMKKIVPPNAYLCYVKRCYTTILFANLYHVNKINIEIKKEVKSREWMKIQVRKTIEFEWSPIIYVARDIGVEDCHVTVLWKNVYTKELHSILTWMGFQLTFNLTSKYNQGKDWRLC